MGLLLAVNIPGQCDDKQAAPPNVSGYSQIAYIEINPPMLEPAIKVFSLDDFVENDLSINGFNSVTKNFKYKSEIGINVDLLLPDFMS